MGEQVNRHDVAAKPPVEVLTCDRAEPRALPHIRLGTEVCP